MILDQAEETVDFGAQHRRRHWGLPALDQSIRPPGRWPASPPGSTPRTARLVLRTDTGSPKAARDFAERVLEEWGMSAPDVTIVVSELVTNAVRYGLTGLPTVSQGYPIQLVLLGHPRRLVLVVTDPSEQVPVAARPEPDRYSENGRGLMVVEALSSAWGWAPLTSGGKAVWAAFELPAGGRAGR
jgi:anti-sigma regulatory factor (Ser/Thr protein kinase)